MMWLGKDRKHVNDEMWWEGTGKFPRDKCGLGGLMSDPGADVFRSVGWRKI